MNEPSAVQRTQKQVHNFDYCQKDNGTMTTSIYSTIKNGFI